MLTIAILPLLAAGSPAVPAWLFPWKEEVAYQYTWRLNRQSSSGATGAAERPHGTTTFTLTWNESKTAVKCDAKLAFAYGSAKLDAVFSDIYDPELRPRLYVSRVTGGRPGKMGGGVGVNAVFDWEKREVRILLGTRKKDPVRTMTIPAEPFRLCGTQAFHHWALFVPFLDVTKKSTVKAITPGILEYLNLIFTPDGTEETRGVEATRLDFTANGRSGVLYKGTIWVGPSKRLLRYQQRLPDGLLDIWITPESMER